MFLELSFSERMYHSSVLNCRMLLYVYHRLWNWCSPAVLGKVVVILYKIWSALFEYCGFDVHSHNTVRNERRKCSYSQWSLLPGIPLLDEQSDWGAGAFQKCTPPQHTAAPVLLSRNCSSGTQDCMENELLKMGQAYRAKKTAVLRDNITLAVGSCTVLVPSNLIYSIKLHKKSIKTLSVSPYTRILRSLPVSAHAENSLWKWQSFLIRLLPFSNNLKNEWSPKLFMKGARI